MEKYAAYQPPKRKGFYLDPRTKILFMAFVTTLMFFVYENLAMDAAVAIIPLTLLLINRQHNKYAIGNHFTVKMMICLSAWKYGKAVIHGMGHACGIINLHKIRHKPSGYYYCKYDLCKFCCHLMIFTVLHGLFSESYYRGCAH